MKTSGAILIAAVVGAVAFSPAVAWAQYSTPLRYDLRYTSPSYIPSGTLRTGPPRQADPYRFGNPLHGNLGVTGNLRLGKSFRGSTPYVRSGSQLANDLPSSRLSDFRRDSFGVEDLGTPLQYGHTDAYYPDSATVTTPWTAGQRFSDQRFRNRIRYLPPNYSPGAFSRSFLTPDNVYNGDGGWTGLTAGSLEAARELGYVPTGLESTEEVLASLRALSAPYEAQAARAAEVAETRTGDDKGLLYPYEAFEKQFRTGPMNVFDGEPAAEGETPDANVERTMQLQYRSGATDLDPWVEPTSDADEFADPPTGPDDEGRTPADRWVTDPGWPESQGQATDADAPWNAFDTREAMADVENLMAEAGARRRATPLPRQPTSGYGQYVLRGHEALRQGKYGLAESLYAAAAALERDRPAALFGRVHALLASRLYLQAASVLERGLAKHPDWVRSVPDLEAVYADKEVFTRIHADMKREVDRGTARQGYRFLLAYVEFSTGNAAEARSHLEPLADTNEAAKAMLEALGPE